MNCKFCNAELEAENTVCPACGKDNAEADVQQEPAVAEAAAQEVSEAEEEIAEVVSGETAETIAAEPTISAEKPVKAKPKKGLVVGLILAGVLLLGALGSALWYGFSGSWGPRENNVQYKDSYTVEADRIGKHLDTVIATVGDEELDNSELQIFYYMQFYNFLNNYGTYASYMGMDYTQPLDTQTMSDGQTWQQYFIETGLSTWQRYEALCLEAEKNGFAMPEELQDQLDAIPAQMEESAQESGYESAEVMLQEEMGPGATIDAYMDYLMCYYYGNAYFESEYNKISVSEDEVEAYFAANEASYAESGITRDTKVVDVRHILLTPEGGTTDENGTTTYSDEEWETCRAAAQEILDGWKAGTGTEESFAELANTHSTDPGSNTNGGLYSDVQQGQMVEAFDSWCFDETRAVGDTGLVKTEYGYHIMYFVGSETVWQGYALSDLVNEKGSKILDDAVAQHTMEVNYKKIVIGAIDLSTDGE